MLAMDKKKRKIKRYLTFINENRYSKGVSVGEIGICNCEYKTSNVLPTTENFTPFANGGEWGTGFDSHAWFHFEFDIPEEMKSKPVQLSVKSDRSGWDADNPQFIAYVNGELRQNSTTEYLIHGVEDILTELSEGMTLQAGTIIATGTPSGVAMGMEQPVYLKPGDVVECFIEGIGTLRNPVK